MSDSLRSYLTNLHDILRSNSKVRSVEASQLVHDIVSLCKDSVSDSEQAYCSSFLFDQDIGILNFVNATVSSREFENAKTDLLKFLAAYGELIGNGMTQYAKYIKDTCVVAVNRDPSSKVKLECYNLLIELIKSEDKAMEQCLDIPELVEKPTPCQHAIIFDYASEDYFFLAFKPSA
eukprot:gene10269-11324_t